MKMMGMWRWAPAVALLAVSGSAGRAGDLAIQSFNGMGQLSFNRVSTAQTYRVEWAPTPSGPWTNFTGAAARLDAIAQFATGSYTCSVPMCYRVVATVANAPSAPNDYLVVDVSGGPTLESYAVSHLSAVPDGGWTDEYKTTKIVFRRMSANTFTMGSPMNELGRLGDEVQHQVTLAQDFYIGVFQITQRQWELVMGNKPSYFSNAAYYQTRPVERVCYSDIRGSGTGTNWPAGNNVDASSFMGVLRAKTGQAFDLPTESQWEYACRAGTATALNSGYDLTSDGHDPNVFWDAHLDQVGRYWFNGEIGYTQNGDTTVGTAIVGSYLPNTWGLYDMHGNIWEWCLDWYDTYPGTVTDPKGAASGSLRVLRGGSWLTVADGCRSSRRGGNSPDQGDYHFGFRVALPQ